MQQAGSSTSSGLVFPLSSVAQPAAGGCPHTSWGRRGPGGRPNVNPILWGVTGGRVSGFQWKGWALQNSHWSEDTPDILYCKVIGNMTYLTVPWCCNSCPEWAKGFSILPVRVCVAGSGPRVTVRERLQTSARYSAMSRTALSLLVEDTPSNNRKWLTQVTRQEFCTEELQLKLIYLNLFSSSLFNWITIECPLDNHWIPIWNDFPCNIYEMGSQRPHLETSQKVFMEILVERFSFCSRTCLDTDVWALLTAVRWSWPYSYLLFG